MFEKSNLKKCRSCGNEFAKSAQECPFCGKQSKQGLFLKLFIAVGAFALIGALAIPWHADHSQGMQEILNAPVDQIDVVGLAKMLNDPKASTKKIKIKKISGKIVQLRMEAFVVTKTPDCYKIVTISTAAVPGALLTVYPQNDRQTNFLDHIKSGTAIKIKGKISGILQGRIKIDPAFLI